jgi:hypothetical protein
MSNPHPMPKLENLKPVTTKEEARIRGRNGGKKSVKVRREKKLLSGLFADIIAKWTGQEKGLNISTVVERVLLEGGSPAVSMLKVMLDATEGSKIKIQGNLSISRLKTMTDDELNKIIDG